MRPDIHTSAGAFVLNAVEPDERAEFEKHLTECESCRDEVAALREVTAALATHEAAPPPPELRARVLSAAQQTTQLAPPPTTSGAVAQRKWMPRLLAAAAAVVVLAGAGVAIREATEDSSAPITAATVFDSSDARVENVSVDGGRLRVGVSKDLGLVALDGRQMPAPPLGHAYQLWLVRDGRATSLSVMERGATTTVEEIPEDGVLALTVEPSGGSEQPTTQPFVSLDPNDI